MGKTVQITCDGCGEDLTTTGNSVDYRLVLATERKPGYGDGAYTDVMISPPVDRVYYFCDLGCLDHWRARGLHEAALRKAWYAQFSTEMGNGLIRFSQPSQESIDASEAEFKAAALAAFPMSRSKP